MAEDENNDTRGDLQAETTLEHFLVACQKSLARSVRSAQQAAKSDSEFSQGERPVYMVDGIEVDLSAGIVVSGGGEGRSADRIGLDFRATGELRSRVRFRVETRPVELLAGAKLEISNLDPLGQDLPDARLRAWLVDPGGNPVPFYPVSIYYARAGDKRLRQPIESKTDCVGRLDFFVEALSNRLKIVGDRTVHDAYVRGSGRGRVPDEYFVWVMCDRRPEWTKVSARPAPHPPVRIELEDGEGELPKQLCSEMLRLRME